MERTPLAGEPDGLCDQGRPDTVAPGRLVDDDVFDDGVQSGWDSVGDEGGHADDAFARQRAAPPAACLRVSRRSPRGRPARAARLEDNCGIRRATTSTSSSVTSETRSTRTPSALMGRV